MIEHELHKPRHEHPSGTSERRLYFYCGLLFGAALGTYFGWDACPDVTTFALVLVGSALAFAWVSARYADAAWEWVMDRLNWLK